MSLTVAELRALFTADVGRGLAGLKAVDHGLDKIDGRTAKANVRVDGLAQATHGMRGLAASITALGPALVPLAATAAGAVAALAGPLAAAGAGTAAFAAVAIPTIKKLTDAEKQLEAARKKADAATTKKGRLAALKQERDILKGMSTEQRHATRELEGFKRTWGSFLQGFEPQVFGVMSVGIDLAKQALKTFSPLVTSVVSALTALGIEARDALASPFWKQFVTFLAAHAGPSLYGLAHAAGDLAKGMASLLMALQPLYGPGLSGLRRLTSAFADWAGQLSGSQGFQHFIDYLSQNGPLVGATLLSIASAFIQLVKAAAPLGPPVLLIVKGLAEMVTWLGKTHPAVLQTALVAIQLSGAIRLVQLGVIKVLGPLKLVSSALVRIIGLFTLSNARLAIATVRLYAWYAAQVVSAAASKTWAAAQWLVNAALTANPIGIVIVAIAALVAGIVIAYKQSATFRKIVDGAFRGIAASAKFMWERVLRPVLSAWINLWFGVVGALVHGAAKAFGWVPGIGGKLKSAAAKFDDFRDHVNKALKGTHSKTVSIHTSGAQAAINAIASLRWEISRVPTAVTVGVFNKLSHIPMRATGGPVRAGHPYIVGERRPEVFVPDRSGHIEPRVGNGTGNRDRAGIHIDKIEVVNPRPERASQSIADRLTRLSELGAFA